MTRVAAACFALAACAACSGDVCSQEYNLFQSLKSKAAVCFPDGGNSGFTFTSCDEGACEKALPSCSSLDQQAMQQEVGCEQNAVNLISSDCGLASLQAFSTAFAKCFTLDAGVSLACGGTIAQQELTCAADGG
ncbi:MAG: hypothetical protein ACYDCL_19565 [Myxococcales bacterium]